MKSNKRRISTLVICVAMLVLIRQPTVALAGASQGMDLCIKTVIPSLLPFFVLSTMLSSALSGKRLPLLTPIGKVCVIPMGQEFAFLSGVLCGYPVGAQNIYQSYTNGSLTKSSAQRMLGFCSNAGPSFIFGITSMLFQSTAIPWILWGLQIISAMITGMLLPGKQVQGSDIAKTRNVSISEALSISIRALAQVCGWVVLFRVLITFLDACIFTDLSGIWRVALSGMFELTNGCMLLETVPEESTRFILCSGFLSFGGACVIMQTSSVVKELGASFYLKGKVIQCSVCLLISYLIHPLLFQQPVNMQMYFRTVLTGSLLTFLLIITMCRKKDVAFSEKVLYNRIKCSVRRVSHAFSKENQ